jgi:hypothetical protein
MQFDPQRAFPYPVLRPSVDDYVDGDFQASTDFSQSEDGQNIVVSCEFALSVSELGRLIKSGMASYVAVISCRDTYFRRPIRTTASAVNELIPASQLRGEVQVFPYIVALKPIERFSCRLINSEFGKGPFSFEVGSVLAIDEPKAIYVDRDLFKPVSSVFELVRNDNLSEAEWRIDLQFDKVQIGVSPQMKERIDVFRNTAKNRAILINSIYFAAVVHCLSELQQSASEYEGRRWAEVFSQQCHNRSIDLEHDQAYSMAQKLLGHPLGLLNTYVFSEATE